MNNEPYKTSGAYLIASVEAIKDSVAEVKADTKSISEKVDVR